MATTYEVGQVRTGRVTRVAEFGAFVELEPGIEGLAHASTFAPTGRAGGWAKSVAVGTTGAFEILSIDPAQKRIGVALVDEGSSRAAGAASPQGAIVPGAIVTGKVERHEKFGVFVFLAPGRTGLMPFAETGVDRDADLLKAFPDRQRGGGRRCSRSIRRAAAFASAGRPWRSSGSRRSCASTPRGPDAASAASLGSLADKLRNALKGR